MGNLEAKVVLASFILYLCGAVLPIVAKRYERLALVLGCYLGAIGSLLGLGVGVEAFWGSAPLTFGVGDILPGIQLTMVLDRLGGFFLATISLITGLVSFYSRNYMKVYKRDNIAWWSFCYNLFVLSMSLVVIVGNVVTFLIFWELMTLTSYFLVTFDYRRNLVRKAGFTYIVMTHLGTVFIISALLILGSHAGSWDFAGLAAASTTLLPATRDLVFVLALIGFGTKAGVVPLHIWLPQAHPAAPTNVSAVMSGVMLKTAIYGMVRLMIDILGAGPVWWGGLVLGVGAVSAVIGVLYALMEHDLKRLLAFHSVENIGIILMGVGVSMVFYARSMPVPAAMALAAGLFHVLNHALFKSLLFLGTGSIYFATHTKDIDKLGGLIKRMPQTALFFLVGSISISAIPPFNGFASEYQIYQSLLLLSYFPISSFWRVAAVLACVTLALTGALAAACFVKAFGISFLALPRSAKAAEAKEVPRGMRLAMVPLAVLCLLLGVVPGPILNGLGALGGQLIAGPAAPLLRTYNLNLALALLVIMLVLFTLTRGVGGLRVRKGETWGCGIIPDAAMEYTAASFSQPIRRVYRPLLQPERKIKIKSNFLPYFTSGISFEEHVRPIFREYLYRPVRRGVIEASKKWQFIQSGSVNLYLCYIFVTLVVLLVWAR